MDFFDDAGDWQWLDDIGGGISDFFSGSSTPNYGQANNLLQPTQPTPQRPIGPLTEQGNFSGDYGLFQGAGNLLSGVSDFYNRNQNWIDPAVGAVGAYYKADRASDAADKYMRDQQPGIDFANKASARQQAYLDPAAVEAGVQADLARKADMLSSRYRGEDMPTYASSLNKGMFGSNTFGKQMALTDAVRDANWANVVVPGAYDQYYKRGTQMSNADTATARMLSGNPVLQKEYRDIRAVQDPWQNMLLNYIG